MQKKEQEPLHVNDGSSERRDHKQRKEVAKSIRFPKFQNKGPIFN